MAGDGEKWVDVRAVLATTQAIDAYGGWQFEREFLEWAAEKLNAGLVPMFVGHDQTRPLRTRGMHAAVVRRDTAEPDGGYWVLQAEYQIHPDDASLIEGLPGMSVSVLEHAFRRAGAVGGSEAAVLVAADAAWFGDAALMEAADAIPREVAVEVAHLYQFSLVPDPQVFFEMSWSVLQAMGGGVAGNATYDFLRTILRRRNVVAGANERPTVFTLDVTDGSRSVKARLETSDEGIAERALDALNAAVGGVLQTADKDSERAIVWHEQRQVWTDPH